MNYRFEGKQKLLSMGEYPDVTLAMVRGLQDANKKLLKAGKDPALHQAEATSGGPDAFETVAREWLEARSRLAAAGGTASPLSTRAPSSNT